MVRFLPLHRKETLKKYQHEAGQKIEMRNSETENRNPKFELRKSKQ